MMDEEEVIRRTPYMEAGTLDDSLVQHTKYLTESDVPDDIKKSRYWGFYSKEIVLSNYNNKMFHSVKRSILKTKITDRWGRKRGELLGEKGAKYLQDNAQIETNILARVERARNGEFQKMITPDFSLRGVEGGGGFGNETKKQGFAGTLKKMIFGGV